MALEIRHYPDPVLLKPAEPVTEFTPRLKRLVEEMFEAMYEHNGVGLAAPQVGESLRLYVLNCLPDQPPEGELVLINPEIVSIDGEQYGDEGCLSFPGMFAKKLRPAKVTMKAQDVEGEWFEVTGEGLLARALVHELDHLDGKVFVQDLELTEIIKLRKGLEMMKRRYKRGKKVAK
jgi:peptide deformylase